MSQRQGYNIHARGSMRKKLSLRLCRRTRQENMKKNVLRCAVRNERAAEFSVWKNVDGTVVRMCHRHGSGDC